MASGDIFTAVDDYIDQLFAPLSIKGHDGLAGARVR